MACRTDNPLRLCRIYACIADVLGMMAAGGIRGGPAANISFKKAFALLEVCTIMFLGNSAETVSKLYYFNSWFFKQMNI